MLNKKKCWPEKVKQNQMTRTNRIKCKNRNSEYVHVKKRKCLDLFAFWHVMCKPHMIIIQYELSKKREKSYSFHNKCFCCFDPDFCEYKDKLSTMPIKCQQRVQNNAGKISVCTSYSNISTPIILSKDNTTAKTVRSTSRQLFVILRNHIHNIKRK